jgi:hypothetical protein
MNSTSRPQPAVGDPTSDRPGSPNWPPQAGAFGCTHAGEFGMADRLEFVR